MRILVTGSRTWADRDTLLDAILTEYGFSDAVKASDCTVVHGGAAGADQMAGRAAQRWGMVEEVHPAEWRPYGVYNPQAGLLRNTQMVALGADVCLAFIKDGSAGATDCANKAEAAGIPTRRFYA